jgi:hypothetical protein
MSAGSRKQEAESRKQEAGGRRKMALQTALWFLFAFLLSAFYLASLSRAKYICDFSNNNTQSFCFTLQT